MKSKFLDVLLYGEHAGTLEQTPGGQNEFTYSADYRGRSPLSLSMPRDVGDLHRNDAVEPFLVGLLPDRTEVRDELGRGFGICGSDSFALLSRIGLDCAGAVQFAPASDSGHELDSGALEPVDEAWIGARLRDLNARGSGGGRWMLDGERWSLGGAQAKFALRLLNGSWFRATGAAPTSHIIKPGIRGLASQALNEHVCLATARAVGLRAAATSYVEFEGEPAIVGERHDRAPTRAGELRRVHQEDLCQALSLYPKNKYEFMGGPSAVDVVNLLRWAGVAADRDANVEAFVDGLAFNYLVGATDAHSKNYSILHAEGRVRLAPLYDVASGLPYQATARNQLDEAAMAIGGERRFGWVGRLHWERFAEQANLDGDQVIARVGALAERVPDAMSDVLSAVEAAEAAQSQELRARLLDRVVDLCSHTRRELTN